MEGCALAPTVAAALHRIHREELLTPYIETIAADAPIAHMEWTIK
jgi:hypothetical protein